MIVFEAGSVICTFAQSSKMFVVGRAVAGLGTSAIGGGLLKLLRHCFPVSKLALVNGIVGSCQSIGLVTAPVIGGALIDTFSWRACFGINIPLGVLCIALTAYGFHDPVVNPDVALPFREKLKRIDLLGTFIVVPAIVCFLIALQWGGVKFGWNDPRIIAMLVLFVLLSVAFGYVQYRQGDKAILPPRILKNRSIIAGMWFSACCNGILAVTEYYISIYLQGVRGFTATKSGLLALPMIAGLGLASIAGGMGTTVIGYYFRECLSYLFSHPLLAPKVSYHELTYCYQLACSQRVF